MINIDLDDVLETGTNYTKNLPLALVITVLFSGMLYTTLYLNYNGFPTDSILPIFYSEPLSLGIHRLPYQSISNYSDLNLTFFSEIEVLGLNLYTYGAILLIILSLILLLAMLATIVLSKNNKKI